MALRDCPVACFQSFSSFHMQAQQQSPRIAALEYRRSKPWLDIVTLDGKDVGSKSLSKIEGIHHVKGLFSILKIIWVRIQMNDLML